MMEQKVHALEWKPKEKLVRRHGRPVELTEEGRLLLATVQPHANGLVSSSTAAMESARASVAQGL
jgi:DNA-binding transcriptional LysR family regulator